MRYGEGASCGDERNVGDVMRDSLPTGEENSKFDGGSSSAVKLVSMIGSLATSMPMVT